MMNEGLHGTVIHKIGMMHFRPISDENSLHDIDRITMLIDQRADLVHMGQDEVKRIRLCGQRNPIPVIEKTKIPLCKKSG